MQANRELFFEEEVVRLFKEGHNAFEISTACNYPYRKTLRLLKEKGLLNTANKRVDHNQLEQLVLREFKAGNSFKQVAFNLKQPQQVIAKILRQHGLLKTGFTYAGKTFDNEREMKKHRLHIRTQVDTLHFSGIEPKAIAEKLNISLASVKRFIGGKKGTKGLGD